jgi:rfaE bifunctional protein nucleotidyltransferase chain/domain
MSTKLKTLSELEDLVADLKKEERIIVFANGCFDLLHVGHVRYLEGARREGDVLIVGLNSDRSVERLKGPDRPILPQQDRAEILAALESVDYLTIFDDETVDPILHRLQPDVHAKGTDYTLESVPERATVLSYGGRIAIVGDPKDRSTRDYMAQIREKGS